MGAISKIEWTDATFNPWIGCSKVSPGCAHCYAAEQNKLRKWTAGGEWGKERRRTSAENWKGPLRWNEKAKDRVCSAGHPYPNTYANLLHGKCYQCGERWENMIQRRPRVFCASLADWLDDEVPAEWLADLLALIHATPNIDWQLLTKRPENWRGRLMAASGCFSCSGNIVMDWLNGEPPPNVWIGTTVENQEYADRRIPEFLKIPARVRFLSCEPLLGAVDLEKIVLPEICECCAGAMWLNAFSGQEHCAGACDGCSLAQGVNWVICGGESGPGARPMNPKWARSLRDQCEGAGVPFFFKQWGEWTSASGVLERVGKHKAGRLLDGQQWNEMPDIQI